MEINGGGTTSEGYGETKKKEFFTVWLGHLTFIC